MKRLLTALLACLLLLSGCTLEVRPATTSSAPLSETSGFSLAEVPEYGGQPYTAVNGNEPYFTQTDYTTAAFERYSDLDALGRCGVAYACVGQELMPTEKRGSIGQVRPSGWQTAKYDNVDGKYLYNRCHLIGYQLTGENANERNLITGTRYLNVQGMLPFENLVADYVKETANHVLYRVTPIFEGSELVARGVLMEGLSMEDDEVCFCVYVYNCQPGIEIDYATGESRPAGTATVSGEEMHYVLNLSSRKFHLPDCASVDTIREENRQDYTGTREDLIAQGYTPCGSCKP